MLSTSAAGTVRIDSQILVVDGDFYLLIDLGVDKDRCKGGVTAVAGVEWGDPNKAVDPHFGLQSAVGVRPSHRDRGALDSGLFGRKQVDYFGTIAAGLRPAHAHPQPHLCPVLRT